MNEEEHALYLLRTKINGYENYYSGLLYYVYMSMDGF